MNGFGGTWQARAVAYVNFAAIERNCRLLAQLAVRAWADVVVWRESFSSALADLRGGEGTGVHIKLDSGMGGLGQSGRRVDAVQEKARVRMFQWRRP